MFDNYLTSYIDVVLVNFVNIRLGLNKRMEPNRVRPPVAGGRGPSSGQPLPKSPAIVQQVLLASNPSMSFSTRHAASSPQLLGMSCLLCKLFRRSKRELRDQK